MKKHTVTGAAILVLGMTSVTVQAGQGHGKGRFMKFFDTNKDGVVNMAEFETAAAKRFERMDADGSGELSREEFREHIRNRRHERKQKHFERMDTNGNGSVERAEFFAHKQARAERKFARMDKNGDGSVSKQEHSTCKKGKHHKKRMFKRMDGDGNGQVSRAESLAAWTNWFKRIDANSDQVVSADEVKGYRNRIHGKGHGHK